MIGLVAFASLTGLTAITAAVTSAPTASATPTRTAILLAAFALWGLLANGSFMGLDGFAIEFIARIDNASAGCRGLVERRLVA